MADLPYLSPIIQGTTPSPRAAHACATVGNRGYVFGGRYMVSELKGTWLEIG